MAVDGALPKAFAYLHPKHRSPVAGIVVSAAIPIVHVVHINGNLDRDDAVWACQHEVNVDGTMRTMRAVLPGMIAQRSGAVVNIASVAAFNAGAGAASYAASKAGVVALSRSAAQACGVHGVRVNALCLGWVDTPMAAREMQDLARELGINEREARDRTVGRIALLRMARRWPRYACFSPATTRRSSPAPPGRRWRRARACGSA